MGKPRSGATPRNHRRCSDRLPDIMNDIIQARAFMPPALAAQIEGMGRVVDPPTTAQWYGPRQLDQEPYGAVAVQRDIAYGPDARNLLDVFVPEAPPGGRPGPRKVLMFVHGGAFARGDRRGPNQSPFNDNVMLWAARHHMVGVNMTYRLAPQHPWPAAQEDIGLAVRWVHEHIAAQGGDATQLHLFGHSAGAAHVATYLGHTPSHRVLGGGVATALMLSGVYALSGTLQDTAALQYFGTDAAAWPQRTAELGLLQTTVPLWFGVAEHDPPSFEAQFQRMHCTLGQAQRRAVFHRFLGHAHMSALYAFNTDDRSVSDACLGFIDGKNRRHP